MSFHIEAEKGAIAEIVFISGDPLRAKFMAETFLENVVCYTRVRGMLGFTGSFQGTRISFQGTGMGMPSTAIYLHELIQDYGAKKVIRLGSCGAIHEDIALGSLICAKNAYGDSAMVSQYIDHDQGPYLPDSGLLAKAEEKANEVQAEILFGGIFSSDSFYYAQEDPNRWDSWREKGVLAVEMESQILYAMAEFFKISALSLLTVSDNIISGAFISREAREQSLTQMTELALKLVV
jgi:purine-nucleoside phosphorylase